ncbi:hypothetical protein [Nostoc sp. 'Peltigera membranacea cyanobiont' 232]|uniref:hypothetical protein n=1 Tax=Nostoc sp. 'Peltigera membranacea cyanobiont' 232 TaxID=2014531 RepID=UPI000B9597A6|nr:hypothetical protein [Nostoc sp. 'Peltigera membranacea cyanobiont' 232]
MNLGVGWVEERNPTPTISGFVGFHFVQPNLPIFYFFGVIKERYATQVEYDYTSFVNAYNQGVTLY